MMATMVGRASSGTSTTQQGKRNKCASWGQHTKRQRHSQQATGTVRPNGVATPMTPLQAAAMAFPITDVNGAGPRWSTAAALGAASRSAALLLPLVMAGANIKPDLQALGTAASEPQMAGVNGAVTSEPLGLGHTAGSLMPVPVRFYGYMSMAGTAPPADGTPGLPLAAALDMFHNTTLARMLLVLMPACHPPLLYRESRSGTPPPRWWPTALEPWWVPDVVAHLPKIPTTAVPFVPSKLLKNVHKVAVIVAIVKHLSPDFARITAAVRHCSLAASEAALWNSALENEQALCVRQALVMQLQQHGGGCNHLPPSHGVVHEAIVATDGVTPPADDGGQVVAVEAQEQPQEQYSGDGGHGSVAPASGSTLAGNNGAHIGAIVTTPSDEVHQVAAAEPEPEKPLPDVDATVFSASDLGDQQLEDMPVPLAAEQANDLHQLANDRSGKDNELPGAAEEQGDRPWYENEELRHKFATMPIGSPHSFDYGWYF